MFKAAKLELFLALKYELAAYGTWHQCSHSTSSLFSSGILWPKRIRFALDPDNTRTAMADLEAFQSRSCQSLPTWEQLQVHVPFFGKLGFLVEVVS